MPSIKYQTDKNGLLSAKIQAYCKDPYGTGKMLYFYKHIYNDKNVPIERFKKMVQKQAIAFESEETLKAIQAYEEDKKQSDLTLQRIEKIRETLAENKENEIMTFQELAGEWLQHVKKDFSDKYYYRAKRSVFLFSDFLHEKEMQQEPVSKIKVRDIQMFLNSFHGQSVNTVKGHKRVLHVIFEDAVRYEWIVRNPVDGVKVANADGYLRPVEEKEVFSMQETKDFIKILDNLPETQRPLRAVYKIMLCCGLRSAEVYGLKWIDIDFDKSIIHVRRNRLYSDNNHEYYEKSPKTRTSLRDIPIPDILIEELKDYYEWYKQDILDLDDKKDTYYLACTLKKQPAACSTLQKGIVDIRKANNITKRITCHGLRHTYCSLLLAQNIPIQTVARYMGHSNSTVTLRVYAHFIPDMQQEFLNSINNAFI